MATESWSAAQFWKSADDPAAPVTALRSASATDAGRVRPTNQDIALVGPSLVAVADGMGGHAAGEVAAEIAVVELRDAFEQRPTLAGLVAATEKANRIIFDKSENEPQLHGMGTTLTAVAIVPGRGGDAIGIVNVGDSRAYLLHKGKLEQVTEDHSLVEEMVRRGDLSPAEAAVHPHRHILTRALGIDSGTEVDSWQMKPRDGMRILLCSDGLTNECTDDEIRTILADNKDVEAAAQALIQEALRHGGNDNITVVVADVTTDQIESDERAPVVQEEVPEEEVVLPSTGLAKAVDASATTGVLAASVPELATSAVPIAEQPPVTGTIPAISRSVAVQRKVRSWKSFTQKDDSAVYIPNGPMFTPRVAFFIIAMLVVIGGAFGFVVWFDKATYFVGIKDGNVAIFNGRPNNLLWMKPTIVETTTTKTSDVFPSSLTILKTGILEASFADAKKVVYNLTTQGSAFGTPTTTTTTTTQPVVTTTTVPVTTTTTTKAATTTTTKKAA